MAFRSILLLFLAIAKFAAITTCQQQQQQQQQQLTIASFNLHGFSKASSYLRDSIQSYGGIWLVQEHWLNEQQLHEFHKLDALFVARSGMEDALSSGIYRGRPFGGVSICWSKDLSHVVVPISNYKHKRIVAVELKTATRNLLLISVYMPFYNSSKREQCLSETLDAISMIELILSDHPNHDFIIGGDLNTELKGESPFDPFWSDLMTKNTLAHCDNFVPSIHYTYRHETLHQTKFNDHFLVSRSLLLNSAIDNHRILDDGANTSDHLPLLLSLSVLLQNSKQDENDSAVCDSLNWKKVSDQDKADYAMRLEKLLLRRSEPLIVSSCRSECGCQSEECRTSIQEEYDDVIQCIIDASTELPRRSGNGVEKDWWTTDLTRLKNQSIEIQTLWIQEGRPRHGQTYQERLRVRAKYKQAIRHAKAGPKQAAWNRLHSAMADQDSETFWKQWKSIYGKKKNGVAPTVDGFSTKEGIAEAFKNNFKKNSMPNNASKVQELNSAFETKYDTFSSNHSTTCNCKDFVFSVEDILDAVFSMKTGKCSDDDDLHAEHFMNAPLILYIKLASLFNYMLRHAFVPKAFQFGTILPLIKDKNGNASDISNYRGITISPIASKVFEHALKGKFSNHFSTSSHQYGFKSKSSTVHALFSLKETINYYIEHGSRVYCSFLDASKAFDRVVHSGLFIKLIERNVPKCLLDILMAWYKNLLCRVRWDGYLTDWFEITAGVRQGGVLSPDLYSIYVDSLISILQSSGIGCYILEKFAASFFYADDMCIIAPSLKGLQKLLDICGSYCEQWDICLNAKKTKNMFFGKKLVLNHRLLLNGNPIEWVREWKYLGVVLKSGTVFGCTVTDRVKSFYRALNSILRVEGRSDDMVLLKLLETHCIPILSYGIEIIHIADRDERRSLRVAYNSVYRKLFGYRSFESVTNLQHQLGRTTWEELVLHRQMGFLGRARACPTDSLIRCFC